MARIVVNNEIETRTVKEALTTLLEQLDSETKEIFEQEIQVLTKLIDSPFEIQPLEGEILIRGTNPHCCGCGACQVTLPLREFFE
jgi:hypothetical protein